MLTQEMNDRLSRVGPDTPCGNLMRCYWHPIAAVADLERDPVQPVRLLGEDLTLFTVQSSESRVSSSADEAPPSTRNSEPGTRNPIGPGNRSSPTYGLVAERCAHRGLSLAYGVPWENGLRCAYHGWTYDIEGQLVEAPFESACPRLRITAYPVQTLAGLIWAYLGPPPAPLVPRWDQLVDETVEREVRITTLPCNWLQCVDNTLDPAHFEHLHGTYGNYVMKKLGKPRMLYPARHLKIDFDVYEYGIYKRRLVEGETEDSPDWQVGHPIIFPYILAVSSDARTGGLVYRVPIDDEQTLSVVVTTRQLEPGQAPRTAIPVLHDPLVYDDFGRVVATHIGRQDEMAFVGQGPIADRTAEHLGTSDTGVMLFRQMLIENMARVERGEDPIAVIRDAEVNEPMIRIERRTYRAGFHTGVPEENWGGFEKVTTFA